MLAETVSEIIHGAASVSFELALDRPRAINLEGTRRVLMFARRCPRLRRLTYLHRAEGLPREGQREDRRQERDADDDAGYRARKSSPITVTLSKSTTCRLRSKGGSLTITAATSFSSLSSSTRTLKVKRLKKAVKKVAR